MVPMAPSSSSRSAMSGRRRSHSTSATRWPAWVSVTARLTAVVLLPSPGSALVITKTFCSWSMSTYCMLVRSTRKASAHGVAVDEHLVRRALGVGVLEDVAEDGGRGDLGDVVGALHAGVEELARHGQADAQQEPEDAGEREVAQRLRRDGRAGDLGVVDEGGLDDGGGLAAGRLELLHQDLQLLGVGLRDVAGALRVGVGGLDLEQHRLRDGRGGDLLAQLHRVGVAELVGHALGELVAGDQVGVRRHALGGEEVAGVGGVLVGLAGRDEDPGGGGVGRGHRPRPHRGDRQDHQDTPENQPPPPSDGAPVVLQLHACFLFLSTKL